MLDTSDGIADSARLLAEASGKRVVVDEDRLPIAAGLRRAAASRTALRAHVFRGGDYELLATLPAASVAPARAALRRLGCPLTEIGRVERGRGAWLDSASGRAPMPEGTWRPFPEVEAVAGRLSGPRYRFPSPPLRSEMDALVAERLTKTYHGQRGTVQALEAVDLTVAKGRLFGFLGRNGAGKTTFIKIAATLLAPTSGRVSLFGHDVVADPWAVRGDIALVPQEGRPFFHMSPREHVYEYLRVRGASAETAKARTDEVLTAMGLNSFSNEPCVPAERRPPAADASSR